MEGTAIRAKILIIKCQKNNYNKIVIHYNTDKNSEKYEIIMKYKTINIQWPYLLMSISLRTNYNIDN